MQEIDFIILNCSGTLTNMNINGEMLELAKKHYKEEHEVMESILVELKQINQRLQNGNLQKSD